MSRLLALTRDPALSTRESLVSIYLCTVAKQTQRFYLRNTHFLSTGRQEPRQL